MRSFQTTIVLEIATSVDDDFFNANYSEDYHRSQISDVVTSDIERYTTTMRIDNPKHTQVRFINYETSEVPNGIRRRTNMFTTYVKSCFNSALYWNQHLRNVWVTAFSTKEDVEFVKNNRNLIVETLNANGMRNTAGFKFPELDDERAQDVWRRAVAETANKYEELWNKAYRKAVMDSFDGDYEDGLIERIRQTSVDAMVDSIDEIVSSASAREDNELF